jgi:hypothetical protein
MLHFSLGVSRPKDERSCLVVIDQVEEQYFRSSSESYLSPSLQSSARLLECFDQWTWLEERWYSHYQAEESVPGRLEPVCATYVSSLS